MRNHWFLVLGLVIGCGSVQDNEVDADPGSVDAAPGDVDAALPACVANTTTCEAGELLACDAAGVPTTTACGFGCFDATRCADLDPANGMASFLDQAEAAAPLVLTGNAVIDTSLLTVTDGNGAQIAVVSEIAGGPVEQFVVVAQSITAGNVRVVGSRALVLIAHGDVSIGGVLNASADFQQPGPGAINGAQACAGGRGTNVGESYSGGGGGGFGTVGGAGGGAGATPGGPAGQTAGNPTLSPLRGGCAGGLWSGNAPIDADGTSPGAGGGAIQISTRGRVILAPGAFIAANGGGAKGYTGLGDIFCFVGGLCGAGCGGGSGGAVLIEAAALVMPGDAGIVVNGGSGHIGVNGRATNGLLSELPAPGTSGPPTGGSGAAADLAPGGGGSVGAGWGNAAGGGGGAGRIRINVPTGATFDPVAPVISPLPSVGATATR
jgi:hypothetical protein